MSPADLPNRPLVRLESSFGLLLTVTAHTANLQEALAVTRSDLRSVVVELAVIDVVFVLSVESKDISGSLLGGIGSLLMATVSVASHSPCDLRLVLRKALGSSVLLLIARHFLSCQNA
jgi:hypothetical protein